MLRWALREALGNAVVHGNHEHPRAKVHIDAVLARQGNIHRRDDQGKDSTSERLGITTRTGLDSEHGRGIRLMKAYMDDVHFERGDRKSICASGCERRPVLEGSASGKRLKLIGQTAPRTKDHRRWTKKTSHTNAANHDYRDAHRTKMDSRRSFSTAMGRRAEGKLEKEHRPQNGRNMHCGS